MAIQKEFFLRYRNTDHLRFQIPARACLPTVACQITAQLKNIPGVYSVSLSCNHAKLAIHYQETKISFATLVDSLYQLLSELEKQGCFEVKVLPSSPSKPILSKLSTNRLSLWFRNKYQDIKDTAHAAKIVGKLSTQGPKALIKDPEKAIIDFLNDMLVLFLIKLHWTHITQLWIRKPFFYRYEWLATFYMFFLLVRSRRKK